MLPSNPWILQGIQEATKETIYIFQEYDFFLDLLLVSKEQNIQFQSFFHLLIYVRKN
jgi:hypothetical protein